MLYLHKTSSTVHMVMYNLEMTSSWHNTRKQMNNFMSLLICKIRVSEVLVGVQTLLEHSSNDFSVHIC